MNLRETGDTINVDKNTSIRYRLHHFYMLNFFEVQKVARALQPEPFLLILLKNIKNDEETNFRFGGLYRLDICGL